MTKGSSIKQEELYQKFENEDFEPKEEEEITMLDSLINKFYHTVLQFTEGGNSNLFVFSKNQTLVESSIESLRQNESLKYRFLQVDSLHRCVPSDWYMIGYDTFAIHTFLRLVRGGGSEMMEGYLKPFFGRTNTNTFLIDYSKEFNVARGIFGYLKFKISIFF